MEDQIPIQAQLMKHFTFLNGYGITFVYFQENVTPCTNELVLLKQKSYFNTLNCACVAKSMNQ